MSQTTETLENVVGTFPELKGKRVLVTGGSAGIGRATALAFAANGARVAVMGRRQERLDAVVARLPQGLAVVGDLMVLDDCKRAVAETVQAFGGLDVLVNNGGAATEDMFKRADEPEGLEAAMRLHVTSVFTLMKAAEEELFKSRGAVVNVSSIAALTVADTTWATVYSTAKAAQDKLTQAFARRWAPHGVNVNSVQPGFVDTEVTAMAANLTQMSEEQFLTIMASRNPIKRNGSPDELAATIVFLASAGAGYIMGAALVVDGGKMLDSTSLPKPGDTE